MVIRGIGQVEHFFFWMVGDTMLDIVAGIGGVVGLLNMEPVFLTFFLLWEEEDLLCWLFLFHKGVHMTLGLALSGVILGDGGDVGPPGTPLITSLS